MVSLWVLSPWLNLERPVRLWLFIGRDRYLIMMIVVGGLYRDRDYLCVRLALMVYIDISLIEDRMLTCLTCVSYTFPWNPRRFLLHYDDDFVRCESERIQMMSTTLSSPMLHSQAQTHMYAHINVSHVL